MRASRKQAIESRANKQAAEKAEAKRQEELKLQTKIAKNLDSHRARANALLKVLKKGAPESYDFGAYDHHLDLQRVYAGDFEPYTGDYESDGQLQLAALRGYVDGIMKRDVSAMNINTINPVAIARERDRIYMAYYAYQNLYAQRC